MDMYFEHSAKMVSSVNLFTFRVLSVRPVAQSVGAIYG